jgi:hypothetical protein
VSRPDPIDSDRKIRKKVIELISRCRTTDDLCRRACLMLVHPAILESWALARSRRSAQRGPAHHPTVRSPSMLHARQLCSLVLLARSGNCCIDCFVSE